jgi:hypothetical protein
LQENGMMYVEPKMVLFLDSVQTTCGGASSACGPCCRPSNQKIFIDLDFFDKLPTRFGLKGSDFAIAYVIAHELGHPFKTLLETSGTVREIQQKLSQKEGNKLSVSHELQADFYDGL